MRRERGIDPKQGMRRMGVYYENNMLGFADRMVTLQLVFDSIIQSILWYGENPCVFGGFAG